MKNRVALGKIVKSVGLRGDVKIQTYSSDSSLREGLRIYCAIDELLVEKLRPHKNMLVARFAGRDSIEDTKDLIGLEIYMDREDVELEDGEYLVRDLIGCEVFDRGVSVGHIEDIIQNTFQDIYVVEGKRSILIPAVDAFVKEIDIDARRIDVELIEGM
jgi:16S rRNA processing protein RimM